MSVKLQTPKYVYMGGGLRPWQEATLHVDCMAVKASANVFEGLKGYWQPEGVFAIVQLRQHYDRLRRSARLLHIPFEMSYEQYRDAIAELGEALLEADRDMWFKTGLFATGGFWGVGTVADLIITAFHQDPNPPEPIDIGVSTWRRSSDDSLPARIKTSTNYQVARLARIEGHARGLNDMVLINHLGRVAEGTGSCLVMVRDGKIATPPATEGALEGITLDITEALAKSAGVPFERRPIDRTELYVANEIALCGTLAELVPIKSIDGYALQHTAILPALQDRFFRAVRAIEPHEAVELTEIATKRSIANARRTPTRRHSVGAAG